MTEKPILFSGPMVRAILDGRKTQTRRVIKTEGLDCCGPCGLTDVRFAGRDWSGNSVLLKCPQGETGTKLWVRETWVECQMCGDANHVATINNPHNCKSCDEYITNKHKPSIFMPRHASRLTLEITGVRVERVQDISERDAESEGVEMMTSVDHGRTNPLVAFQVLWQSINGKRGFGWGKNPWVWVIEFKRP